MAHTTGQDGSKDPRLKTERGWSSSTWLLNRLTPEHLRLPEDGDNRKAAYLQRQRRALLVELRGYSDADGRNVRPSVQSLCRGLGLSRSTIFRLLADLRKLDLILDEPQVGASPTRRRRLNLAKAQALLAPTSTERPAGLPACIPTPLWNSFRRVIEVEASPLQPAAEIEANMIRGLVHWQLHMEMGEEFVVELVEHCVRTRFISFTLWLWDIYGCGVAGCDVPENDEAVA